MHYLEDDLDLLDGVPEELREQCLEMQSLDAQVEKALLEVKEDSREFFNSFNKLNEEEKIIRHKKIKESYRIIRQLGEDKMAIAEFLELMLEKYQERIAKDLNEFKFELEADTAGITEGIEKELCEAVKNASSSRSRSDRISSESDLAAAEMLYDDAKLTKFASPNSFASTSGAQYAGGNAGETASYGGEIRHGRSSRPDKHQQNPSKGLAQKLTMKNTANHYRSSTLNNSLKRHKFVSDHYAKRGGKDLSQLGKPDASEPSSSAGANNEFGIDKDLSESVMRNKKSRSALMLENLGPADTMDTMADDSGFEDVKLSKAMLGNGGGASAMASTSSVYPSMMPAFAGGQESQYGRPVKQQAQFVPLSSKFCATSVKCRMDKNNNNNNNKSAHLFSRTIQKIAAPNTNKLTSRVQQMLKDRHVHRMGRVSSSFVGANNAGSFVNSPQMRHNSSGNFIGDEKSRGHAIRNKLDVFNRRRMTESGGLEDDMLGEKLDDEDLEEALDDDDAVDEENDDASLMDDEEGVGDEEEEEEDQDNRVWCLCQQKSEGDMVACDNRNCPYEWFHYGCVGITATPKGKWYCPVCSKNMRRSHSMESR